MLKEVKLVSYWFTTLKSQELSFKLFFDSNWNYWRSREGYKNSKLFIFSFLAALSNTYPNISACFSKVLLHPNMSLSISVYKLERLLNYIFFFYLKYFFFFFVLIITILITSIFIYIYIILSVNDFLIVMNIRNR